MFLNLFVVVNFGCRQDAALEDHDAVGCDAVQTSGITDELHSFIRSAAQELSHGHSISKLDSSQIVRALPHVLLQPLQNVGTEPPWP